MDYIEILGFIAGGLVSLSFLPQVIKSWKTKSTGDLAISLTIINILGQILWIAYGVSIHSYALVIMSVLYGGLVLFWLGKLSMGRRSVLKNNYKKLLFLLRFSF